MFKNTFKKCDKTEYLFGDQLNFEVDTLKFTYLLTIRFNVLGSQLLGVGQQSVVETV